MAGDWRERFLELEQQAESASEAHQQAERELTRLVTRICVACSGFDPQLDTQLDRLRKVARKGRADALIRQSEEFADSIVHAAEDRFRPGVLARLLDGLALIERRHETEAMVALHEAEAELRRRGMATIATVTRAAHGVALGGDAGATFLDQARHDLRAFGVRHPDAVWIRSPGTLEACPRGN